MKFKTLVCTLAAGLAAGHYANAAEFATSLDLGTTGFGLHMTTPITAKLNARVGVNFANYSYNSHTSDVDYGLKLKLATFDALLDYHPFDGSFRASGGAVYNDNTIRAHAKPNGAGTYTINGNAYDSSEVGDLSGNIDFRKVAPYLGIGWGNATKEAGWGFGMDLGVTFQGSPKTGLASNGCAASTARCAQLGRDIAAENVKLSDDLNSFRLYPVIRAGVSYRF